MRQNIKKEEVRNNDINVKDENSSHYLSSSSQSRGGKQICIEFMQLASEMSA